MNTKIAAKVGTLLVKVGFKMRAHAPEILTATGITGVIATVITACTSTIKAEEILSEHTDRMEKIHEVAESEKLRESGEYDDEQAAKDTLITYVQTGAKLAKLYAPSIILGATSIACLVGSNRISKRRNIELATAYVGLNQAFKQYRKNVTNEFGKDADKRMRFGVHTEEKSEKTVDKRGKEKTVTKSVNVVAHQDVYARVFGPYSDDQGSFLWDGSHGIDSITANKQTLQAQLNLCNQKLIANGWLTLNEVYRALGFPETKAGMVVGWIYDPKNPVGDNYIDFGLPNDDEFSEQYNNWYLDGEVPVIPLEFNVDGYIFDRVGLKEV